MLELDRLPEHLIVLGGGYVGLELAQAYRRFGSRVTVVEHGPQLAGREDPDVADAIGRLFGDEGIEVLLSAEVLQVEGRSGEGVRLRVRTPQGERSSKAATSWSRRGARPTPPASGWTPRACGSRAGLHPGQRPPPDEGAGRLGDRRVRRQPPVHAHVRGRLPRDALQPGRGGPDDRDRLMPFCLFTDPQLARVGLSEPKPGAAASRCASPRYPWRPCFGRGRWGRRAAS